MARDTVNIGSKGGSKAFKTEDVRGVREEKGVVIGIVKANSHPTRMGVISVFVPGYGNTGTQDGKKLEDNPTQWRQVRWASPFYSTTSIINPATDAVNVKNTAGFVYPTPDLQSRVLCVFPEGRNAEGFWFACAPDLYMMQSLPEASATSNFENTGEQQPRFSKAPGLEFNDLKEDTLTLKSFLTPKRAIADNILNYLIQQGLDQDETRGLSTSSVMRETPSDVLGISTKGRRVDKNQIDIKDRNDIITALKNGTDLNVEQNDVLTKPVSRLKGHVFVMDDGDLEGNNNLVRLRTAGGHQLLMHDTGDIIYLGNAKGTVWLQFDGDGQIDLYSDHNINIRSKNLNFHADESIKMHAKKSIQMVTDENMHLEGGKLINVYSDKGSLFQFAGEALHVKTAGSANIQSSNTMNLKGGSNMQVQAGTIHLNGSAADAGKQEKAKVFKKDDVVFEDYWEPDPAKIETTVDRVVTHEPFALHRVVTPATVYKPATTSTTAGSQQPETPKNPPSTKDTGLNAVKGEVNNEKIKPVAVVKQPENTVAIGKMDSNTVKAVSAGVGDGKTYSTISQETASIGKYGFNTEQLQKAGYVKPEALFNTNLSDPKVWTGKDGMLGRSDFLASDFLQENLFQQEIFNNYQGLLNNGAIKSTDDVETISGMVSASYSSTVEIARQFREGTTIQPRPLPGTTMVQSTEQITSEVKRFYKVGASAARMAKDNFASTSINTDGDF